MGWWSRLFASSPEEDGNSRYVDNWLRATDLLDAAAAGVRVTISDALGVPGIAACVQVLAEDVAKVPLELKRRTEGGFEPAIDHPLYALLKFGPAPWLSSSVWREAMVRQILTHGKGFSRVWRDSRGVIERLTPLRSSRTTVRWGPDGEPFFDLTGPNGIERGLTWQEVVHIPYRASLDHGENDGIAGVSPIAQNRNAVGLAIAAEKFASNFFRHGARPSFALEMPERIPNKQVGDRLRAEIDRVYVGADATQKIMLLDMGMKLKEFSTNPSDSQLVETRKEQAVQCCTMFRVPPHKIGVLDKATFSNIEQQSIDYVTGPISALAKGIESALSVACLTPEERETLKIEHNLEGLMRGDILSRYRAYAIGRQWGWLSADDVRETENKNKLPDGAGERYLEPMNMAPAGAPVDDGSDPTPADNGGDEQGRTAPGSRLVWLPESVDIGGMTFTRVRF